MKARDECGLAYQPHLQSPRGNDNFGGRRDETGGAKHGRYTTHGRRGACHSGPLVASPRPQAVTRLPDEIILLSHQERNEITQSAYLASVKEKDKRSCLAPVCPCTHPRLKTRWHRNRALLSTVLARRRAREGCSGFAARWCLLLTIKCRTVAFNTSGMGHPRRSSREPTDAIGSA